MNNDTVDCLFGFTDFNKFKKLVLQIKNGDIEVKFDKDMKASSIPQAGEQFFWDLYNEDPNDKNKGWIKKMDYKGNIEFQSW